ncbi:MAG: zinc ribbon domain-containing protein [candidate division WOR-3 bacterium]|uniref:DZANK-type domain-containing protein n=1 Tax=candidate division WOR-3 bacterium TaxID=2052148 RepID=A0A7V4CHI3_UNCW3
MKEKNNCHCPFCNQELAKGKIFCKSCKIEFKKCPHCEKLIPHLAKECPYCHYQF